MNFEYNIKEKLRVTETGKSQQPPKKFYANFTGKHLCQSLFFSKVAGLTLPGTFLLAGRPLLKWHSSTVKSCNWSVFWEGETMQNSSCLGIYVYKNSQLNQDPRKKKEINQLTFLPLNLKDLYYVVYSSFTSFKRVIWKTDISNAYWLSHWLYS